MTIGFVLGPGILTLSASAGPVGIALGVIAGGLLVVTSAALLLGSSRPRRRLVAVA